MLYRALLRDLAQSPAWDDTATRAAGPQDRLVLTAPDTGASSEAWLDALVRQMYDLAADDARMRDLLSRPPSAQASYFNDLRKRYPRRRTFRLHSLPRRAVPEVYRVAVTEGLGLSLVD
jgi:erythronate-4-phosphate dehydrogenase